MDGREGLRSLMADFLLELLSEEIPARMQAKARNDLSRLFAESTAAAGLETGAIEALSTPRRLVLIARNIAEATQASSEAQSANVVASNIQHIFAVTEQTGEGTRSTAQMVRELSRSAEELKQSVARFKVS